MWHRHRRKKKQLLTALNAVCIHIWSKSIRNSCTIVYWSKLRKTWTSIVHFQLWLLLERSDNCFAKVSSVLRKFFAKKTTTNFLMIKISGKEFKQILILFVFQNVFIELDSDAVRELQTLLHSLLVLHMLILYVWDFLSLWASGVKECRIKLWR